MKRLMVLIGAIFVLLGIVAEGMYFAGAQTGYNGSTISTNAYLISGLFLIVLGLVLTVAGARIPKIRFPHF